MFEALRNRILAARLETWTWSLRVRRVFGLLGRPRLRLLDHVTLPVLDLEEACRFYCDLLGATCLMSIDAQRPPGRGVYHASLYLGGRTRIELFEQEAGPPELARARPHLAFRVPPGDILKWRRRLDDAGVPCEGPLQLGFAGQASLYFSDPSGNLLEIVCHGFAESLPLPRLRVSALGWTAAARLPSPDR
jgi:catechol 2,3-dioxygenase-like lactoylglutathione lyase family enzyme